MTLPQNIWDAYWSEAKPPQPLKPTIVNGQWVYLPPPPQDAKWLSRRLK